MTILFGRTQDCNGTPFEPNRVTALWPSGTDISATNAQDAIEEAKADALANDRFLVLAHYGGNSNVGRYLEFFPNEASDTAPIFLTVATRLLSVTLQTTSASATCTVGFFDLNVSSVTPVYTISLAAQKRKSVIGLLATFSPNALLAVRVTVGSINSPTMQITFSAST